MARAYYNENDKFAAEWIRENIGLGLIPPGEVDDRSIADVQPSDLKGFTQCHFFAGIGGWGYAARLAGWPDDRPLWTGSCPCQPFSQAGAGRGHDDPRDLWPHLHRLARAGRPAVVVGEQVAGKAGWGWFDRVRADLARIDYAGRAVGVPACAVNAPQLRERQWWVALPLADADRSRPVAGRGHHAEVPRLQVGEGRADVGSSLSRRVHDPAFGDLADACGFGPGRGPCEPGGNLAHGAAARWGEGASRASERDGFSEVDAASDGRREGRPERRMDGGGASPADADAPGFLGDASGARQQGFSDAGGVGGHTVWRSDAQRADGRDGRPRHVAHPDIALVQRLPPTGQFAVDEPDARNGLRAGSRHGFYDDAVWIICHDGKARRAEPGVPLLAHGVSARVPKWRGFGNAIHAGLAAEVLGALLDTLPPHGEEPRWAA